MRTILVLIIGLLFAGGLAAQPATTSRTYRTTDTPVYVSPENDPGLIRAFPERVHWETQFSWSFADIVTPGVVDTSFGDEVVYYGKMIPTARLSGWPRLHAAGIDSANIVVEYRHVAFTSGGIAAGPWTALGDTLTLTNPRSRPDTLVAIPSTPSFTDSTFEETESGYMQHRYKIKSTKANKNGGAADVVRPPVATQNYHWRGEIIITIRRDTL